MAVSQTTTTSTKTSPSEPMKLMLKPSWVPQLPESSFDGPIIPITPKSIITLLVTYVLAPLCCIWQPLRWQTAVLAGLFSFISILGVTAGYHRHFAHGAFRASTPLKMFLIYAATSTLQGTIIGWVRNHRLHHRFTDTARDPHSVKAGFWMSHIGWMFKEPHPENKHLPDISDLVSDPILLWQHKNYAIVGPAAAYFVPAVIAYLGWNDLAGGLLYAGFIRQIMVLQATACTTSLAHMLGEQPYNEICTAVNIHLLSFMTLGESYHNYHHTFPTDYRNGVKWFDMDITKWFIAMCARLGQASDLQVVEQNEIDKAIFQRKFRQLDASKHLIDWGSNVESLPIYTWQEFQDLCAKDDESLRLICIAGVIYNVSSFMEKHPGGKLIISSYLGTDATASFNGGVYDHSHLARNLLDNMRFGLLRMGLETEYQRSFENTL